MQSTAITDPWRLHYKMFSYITVELVEIINVNFSPMPGKQSIFGHSMGGHGALVCALRNPGMYQSVSAFAPISNPKLCPWGEKAFTGYLGDDKELWSEYDATELVAKYKGPPLEIFVDQVIGFDRISEGIPFLIINGISHTGKQRSVFERTTSA